MIPLSELTNKGIDEIFRENTKDDLPRLEEELENLKVEYERENGYPIDMKDEIPDDIEELVNIIDNLKKLSK